MTRPSDSECDRRREQRQARKMRERGIVVARWRGCPKRMFKRMSVFISLDGAAECRRAGRYHLARCSLYRANREHYAWVNAGGYLP